MRGQWGKSITNRREFWVCRRYISSSPSQGAAIHTDFPADDRAELCKKLSESREREIKALKMALQARKSETNLISMFNKRMKIDVGAMKGGHSDELEALQKALVHQEQQNVKLRDENNRLRDQIEFLRKNVVNPAKLSIKPVNNSTSEHGESSKDIEQKPSSIDFAHPWMEWKLFMEHLKKNSHLKLSEIQETDLKSREEKIKAAAMSFCQMHENIVRRLSQEDLVVFGSFGCPNTDRRIVNSGKRLRKFLNLAETDVCRFCSLGNVCSRAHAENSQNGADVETSDVVWLLLQFGLDTVNKPVEKRPLPAHIQKTITNLLKQLVFLAENPKLTVMPQEKKETELQPGDWRCTSCKTLNFSGSRLCRGCDTPCGLDILRLGEWKCIKCNSKNNGSCILCQECSTPRPPKEVKPGDWECPKCRGVNFARNKECYRCKTKQPSIKGELIGVNKNIALDLSSREPPSITSLGVTPWLVSEEEKQASLNR